MCSRRGWFIAIVGPDGVGKTTLANHLLNSAPEPTGYVHFRPPILQSLPPRPKSLTVVMPDKDPPQNRPLGWLRLSVSIPRFWIGYLVRMMPLLLRGGTVVADRWAYGYVAQPRALRFFGPPGLARFAMRLIPGPDLVINLTAPADLISSRKAELSVDEINSELQLWSSLPVSMATFDATLPPKDLAEIVRLELERRSSERRTSGTR